VVYKIYKHFVIVYKIFSVKIIKIIIREMILIISTEQGLKFWLVECVPRTADVSFNLLHEITRLEISVWITSFDPDCK
jgi:hypothetical protein